MRRHRNVRDARVRARPEHGQSTVELALLLPLLAASLVMVVQVALVGRDEILVVHAARDAAREAAVTADPARVAAAARRTLTGARVRIVRRGAVGQPVEVEVAVHRAIALPLLCAVLPDITLHARAVMRVERP